jgi:hypothetical protein
MANLPFRMQPKTRHNKMARVNKKKVALADAATPKPTIRDILALGSSFGGTSDRSTYAHITKLNQ